MFATDRRRSSPPRWAPRVATVALALAVASLAARAQVTPTPAATPPAPATGGRIAVVNVSAATTKAKEYGFFKDHIQAQGGMIRAQKSAHEAQIRKMFEELQSTYKPDSDQYAQKLAELDNKQAEFNYEDQKADKALSREFNTGLKKMYDKMLAVVADLAKRKGIDIVTVYNDVQLPPNVQQLDQNQLNQVLSAKQVLYVSEKIDLTNEVVAALDAQYRP